MNDYKVNETVLEFQTNFKLDIVKMLQNNKYLKKYKMKETFNIGENKTLENIFEKQFKELIRDNVIQKATDNKYKLCIDENLFIGKIFFNALGNAFVSDGQNDCFISKKDVFNAFHEDIVLIVKTKNSIGNKRAEAKVISVLDRTIIKVIGTFMQYEKGAFVIPDNNKINRDIYIPDRFKNNSKSYDKVVVKIHKYPSYKIENGKISIFNPEGEIIENLGSTGDKGVDNLSVIKENNIRDSFSSEVKREAERINVTIKQEEKDLRVNLTDEIIYTIDGKDAKDLDDAISIKKIKDEYELGVHIADVSYYVKENGAIDHEALLRGTSVYLIDQVIPMLPKVLCNNVCSLNPNEEKLTLSCIMRIDNIGNLKSSKVVQSFIKSKARLVYEDVTDFLENKNKEFEEKYPEVCESLLIGKELSEILYKKRLKRGSVEFDTSEPKFILDEDGKVIEIKAYERGISNNMIEEFMLIANETIAEKFFKLKIPFVYRIHEVPKQEKLEIFDKIAKNYGFETTFSKQENIESKELQDFLTKNSDNENIESFKLLLLQSMQQARYSNKCLHHFGLGADYYCHFTSPIRRYPDLQIHRIITDTIKGNINKFTKEKYEKKTEEVAEYCSKAERKAEQAERDLDKSKMYEYISNHKDDEFIGRIRSFNKTGFFVTLDNTAEGYVKPLNFKFDMDNYSAKIGESELKLGQKIKVKLKNINNNNIKEILFDIVEFL